jgi:hypothetical protein
MTSAALRSNPNTYDFESILPHEPGHSFGFDHSGEWSAMMNSFAPPPNQIKGRWSTAQSPDAPLWDDDCAELRVLYPDPTDSVHICAISGRVVLANPLELPILPSRVTGVFPAYVVAVDNAIGTVTAAVMADCGATTPAQPNLTGSYPCSDGWLEPRKAPRFMRCRWTGRSSREPQFAA